VCLGEQRVAVVDGQAVRVPSNRQRSLQRQRASQRDLSRTAEQGGE
jgi:hypothetical protein